MNLFKIIPLVLFASFCFAQRPTPLENALFKTDADVNYKKLTNVNAVVFYDSGSNVIVNASTFLTLFEGQAKTLIDTTGNESFLFVSNGIPWVTISNSTKKVIMENDTTFIRQGESLATVTNMVVLNELLVGNSNGVDDTVYNVTQPSLTNGAISELRIENFLFFVTNSVLTVLDKNTGITYPLAP